MKTLTLMRHAKSGWDDPTLRDFDRTLNAKGRRAAATVGRYLRAEGIGFDHLVASPAVRVRETLDAAGHAYGARPIPCWDERLYLAPVPVLLEVIHALPAEASRVLLVGHNPGLEDLVLALVPEGEGLWAEAARKYPTATVAEMTFDVADWGAVTPGAATLTRFIRPRDLDPALGPDEE